MLFRSVDLSTLHHLSLHSLRNVALAGLRDAADAKGGAAIATIRADLTGAIFQVAAAREALELEGNTARLVRVAARALAAAGAAVRGVLDERGDARGTAQRLGGGRRRHHFAAVAVVLVLLELLDLVVQLVDGVGCVLEQLVLVAVVTVAVVLVVLELLELVMELVHLVHGLLERVAVVAALLAGAALPGGHAYSPLKKAIFPQQPTYKQSPLLVADSDYQYQTAEAQTAGILWHGTPKSLTPTNFTVMFPDLSTDLGSNDRIEIHLPGFGGAYNSFGAKHPDSTAVAGAFHPLQNGVSMYSREHCYKIDFTKQAFVDGTIGGVDGLIQSGVDATTGQTLTLLTAQDLTDLDPMIGDYVRLRDDGSTSGKMEYARITGIPSTTTLTLERNVHPPCLDGQKVGADLDADTDEVLLVTGAAHQQCIQTVEWDPKREVLKITAESGATPATVCNLDYFNGVTIDEAYLRQYYQRDGLPSGKGPLPPAAGIDRDWYRKAWVRRYSSSACASGAASAQRPGLGKETCDVTRATQYMFNRDLSTNMQFESNMEFAAYSTQTKDAVGTTVKPSFSWLAASGSKTGDRKSVV